MSVFRRFASYHNSHNHPCTSISTCRCGVKLFIERGDNVVAPCEVKRYKPYPMIRVRISVRGLHLCVVMFLLIYLFAGASFALPVAPSCARCATMNNTSPAKPGASCPLSSRGHHCHGEQDHTAGKIVFCSDGCMHDESTSGEIPLPAKFLSSLRSNPFAWFPTTPASREAQLIPPTFFLSPPYRPPSASQ
jgi:hypothetical protein